MTKGEELVEKLKKLPEAEKHTYWDEMPDGSRWNDGDDGVYCIDRHEMMKLINTFLPDIQREAIEGYVTWLAPHNKDSGYIGAIITDYLEQEAEEVG